MPPGVINETVERTRQTNLTMTLDRTVYKPDLRWVVAPAPVCRTGLRVTQVITPRGSPMVSTAKWVGTEVDRCGAEAWKREHGQR